LGRIDDAISHLREALRLDPTLLQAKQMLEVIERKTSIVDISIH
jgi:hypothetical protein